MSRQEDISVGVILGFPADIAEELQRWLFQNVIDLIRIRYRNLVNTFLLCLVIINTLWLDLLSRRFWMYVPIGWI